MSTLTLREVRPFGDLFDWMESPISPIAMFRPTIRMEDFVRDGHYVIRAELPGLDPEKELDVTVTEGVLIIKAERHEHEEIDKSHSEFRYGAFSRRIVLPADADPERIQANYDKGILEIVIDLKDQEARKAEKRISIKQAAKALKAG